MDRIVASEATGSGARLADLLRYVVTEELEGRGERLKAYTIGTDVSGKPADFDPQLDSSVRVEMGRLRKALDSYYSAHARPDDVLIEIPRGRYRPVFAELSGGSAPAGRAEAAEGRARLRPAVVAAIAGAFALVAVAAFLVWRFDGASAGMPADLAKPFHGPRIGIARINVTGDGDERAFAAGLSAELISELARYSWLGVFSGSEAAGSHDPPDYWLAGSVTRDGDSYILSLQLLTGKDRRIVWSEPFRIAEEGQSPDKLVRDAAQRIAAVIAPRDGIAGKLALDYPPDDDKASIAGFRCFLGLYELWDSYSTEKHAALRACLEKTVVDDPGYSDAWAALAFVYLDEHRFGTNSRPGHDSLKEAIAAAERAAEIAPTNTLALQALFTVEVEKRDRNLGRFREIGYAALRQSPNNAELLADFANKLAIFAGDFGQSKILSDRAFMLNRSPPPWYWWGPTLVAMAEGRNEEAYQDSLRLGRLGIPYVYRIQAAAAARYAHSGDAVHFVDLLRRGGFATAKEAAEAVVKRRMADAIEKATVAGLRQAYALADGDTAAFSAPQGRGRPSTPVLHVTVSPLLKGDKASAANLFEGLASGFDVVSVMIGPNPRTGERILPEDFSLELKPSVSDGQISLQLYADRSRALLARIELPLMSEPTNLAVLRKYQRAAAQIFGLRGILLGSYFSNGELSPVMDCFEQAMAFWASHEEGDLGRGYGCFERLHRQDDTSLVVNVQLALLMIERAVLMPAPERRREQLASKAILLKTLSFAPESPAAHAAFGYLSYLLGDDDNMIRHVNAALNHMAVDPSIMTLAATPYCISGRSERCLEIIGQAERFFSFPSPWLSFMAFTGQYAAGNLEAAGERAAALAGSGNPLYIAAQAISAHRGGRDDFARELLQQLVVAQPLFAADPAEPFRRFGFAPELVDAFASDLRDAGIARVM
ncbi:MAG: hypothetical protein AB7L41_10390 [Flavobacteriaceae bacterium]